ncbi:hypothetical protein MTO96_029709 [Rhipicephalus appendiculatus]
MCGTVLSFPEGVPSRQAEGAGGVSPTPACVMCPARALDALVLQLAAPARYPVSGGVTRCHCDCPSSEEMEGVELFVGTCSGSPRLPTSSVVLRLFQSEAFLRVVE